MHSRSVDRFFYVLSKPEILNNSLEVINYYIRFSLFIVTLFFYVDGRRGDFGAAGRPDNRTDFAVGIDDDGGRHGGQRPLARFDKVGRTGRHSVRVCDVWRGKIVHFVIQDDARLLRGKSSTETVSKTIKPSSFPLD